MQLAHPTVYVPIREREFDTSHQGRLAAALNFLRQRSEDGEIRGLKGDLRFAVFETVLLRRTADPLVKQPAEGAKTFKTYLQTDVSDSHLGLAQ